MSILGVDWGDRRIGIAISENKYLAKRLLTIKYSKINKALSEINKLSRIYGADLIILGLPKTPSGQNNTQAKKIKEIGKKLKEKYNMAISFIDEAYTTQEAESRLKEAGFKKNKVKEILDQESARIILQDYLDKRRK